jgi:hypothetical protein
MVGGLAACTAPAPPPPVRHIVIAAAPVIHHPRIYFRRPTLTDRSLAALDCETFPALAADPACPGLVAEDDIAQAATDAAKKRREEARAAAFVHAVAVGKVEVTR